MGRRRARRDVDASRHRILPDEAAAIQERRRRAAGRPVPNAPHGRPHGTARGHRRGPFSCPATVGHSGCGLRTRGWFGYGPAAERV